MRALKSGIIGGIIWACASLLLVAISIALGDQVSWVELDFRPLTGTVLLAADALGLGTKFDTFISYAQNGMPITPENIVISIALGFADGFASGFLIALIYNILKGKQAAPGISVLSFGLSFGLVFALCSGILAAVSLAYAFHLESFDFSIKPLFLLLTQFEEFLSSEFLYRAKESYIYFPKNTAGVFYWILWGFIDGFAGGALLAYIYTKIWGKGN